MAEKNLSPLQVRLLEMMKWFHQFCVEHDLRYFCLGGTMLGAQRHHGFIPWDDDIDVGLPRRDYEKLMELMKDDNYDPFVLETPYSRNADYCYPYSKLYDTRTTLIENRRKDVVRGIFIDVFPLDGIGETEQESIHNYKRINKKYNMLLTTVCGIRRERSWYKNLAVLAVRCIPSYFLSYKRLMMELDRLCALVDYDSSTWVCNCLGAWRFREAMERKYYGNPLLYQFEDIQVYGVEKYNDYLTRLYGDWRQLPPVEKQKTHHDFIYLNLNKPYLDYIKISEMK